MNTVIILGSSRSNGDTKSIVDTIVKKTQWDVIDLNDYSFSYYDYNHKNRNDDYLELMRSIIEKYDALIFATPVYWYSMSGIMKVFFDRITDLLTIEKELGRQLRGKGMAVLSHSHSESPGDFFWVPFRKSADYLGMRYLGNVHTVHGDGNEVIINRFVRVVNGF